jgi:hypothetical protein
MKLVRAAASSAAAWPATPFDAAGADLVLVLADLLVDGVGRELGDHRAAAGQDAQEGADHAAAQGAGDDALELRPGRHQLDLAVERRALVAAVQVLGDLGDAEAAQRDADQADAVGQEGQVHGEALHAAVDVGADLAEQHADQAHRHAVEQAAGGDEAHADEADQHQGAVVGRPEQEGHLAQRGRQEGEHDDGHRAADEARDARGEQGQPGLALERHLVAVDAGHDAAGVRDLHRDGADAVAVLGAVVDAGQHDERAAGGNGIRQRQQDADGGQRAQPGSRPTSVPTVQPMAQYIRFCQVSAWPNPKRKVVEDFHVSTAAG